MNPMATLIFWGLVFTIGYVARLYVPRVAGWGLTKLLIASFLAAVLLQTLLVFVVAMFVAK
ncbi:MAG: hypothetical protein EBR82_09730 [Caulobacteraceae bacterium]|nr:hypothetical protein [Caulobacteraceae bacterium]